MDSKKHQRVLTLDLYTDGACKSLGKATFGGWGFIAVRDSERIYFDFGNENATTNQRMELTAVLKALEYSKSIRKPSEHVHVYSDSAYIVNCYLQEWYVKWIANSFQTSTKKPVANQDLWIQIIPYFDNFWYHFHKVEGHNGVFWNEECDQLAQEAAEHLKLTWRGSYE